MPHARYVRDGEPLDEQTLARPVIDVEARLDQLAAAVAAAAAGEAARETGRPADPACAVGMAVAWDPAAGRYVRATGDWWGVVERKPAADRVDLVLFGASNVYPALSSFASQPAPGQPPGAGAYHLDPREAGRLTRTPPGGPLPVLLWDGAGRAVVGRPTADRAGRHTHRRITLTCRPAGTHTPPATGNPHTISSPNPALPGWLPASHASFGGLAPGGAVWGYNLAADASARAAWPPVPADGAWAEWDRGTAADRGAVGTPAGRVLYTPDGIWWATAANGEVPWPPDLDTGPNTAPGQVRPMTLVVHAADARGATAGAVVTGLVSVDTRLTVGGCTPGPCETGRLTLDLDLNPAVTAKTDYAATAVRAVGDKLAVTTGPVLAGAYAASAGVALVGGTVDAGAGPGGEDVHRGLVGISVDPAAEVPAAVDVFRFAGGVEQGDLDGLPYFRLPAGRDSRLTAVVRVPALFPAGAKLAVDVWAYCPGGGTPAALRVDTRRYARPDPALGTPLPTSGGDLLDVPLPVPAVATGRYVRSRVKTVTPAAGDLLQLTVRRSGTDGYAGEVGLLLLAAAVTTL